MPFMKAARQLDMEEDYEDYAEEASITRRQIY